MNQDEFEFISQLIKKHSGLALTPDKMYLLESRLMPIARSAEHADLSGLIGALKKHPDPKVISVVVDAMTTNESMFFRDTKPFDQLRRIILPRFREAHAKEKRIRIWSAACSNGQEPYSVAICLLEEAQSIPGFTCEILATDISQRVLAKAIDGIYTQFEVQRGLPIAMLLKYFRQLPDNTWQINEKLRSMVSFRGQNLLEDFGALGRFDIILCRNVLIYFDEPTKRAILDRASRVLNSTGVLMLGSTETIIGLSEKFQNLGSEHGLYVAKG